MEPAFISVFMPVTRRHEFRLQGAAPLSLKIHSAQKFVFNVMFLESTDFALDLLLNHNDQHFHCTIQQFNIILQTDDCDSWVSKVEPTTPSTHLIVKSASWILSMSMQWTDCWAIMCCRLDVTVLSRKCFEKHSTVLAIWQNTASSSPNVLYFFCSRHIYYIYSYMHI